MDIEAAKILGEMIQSGLSDLGFAIFAGLLLHAMIS